MAIKTEMPEAAPTILAPSNPRRGSCHTVITCTNVKNRYIAFIPAYVMAKGVAYVVFVLPVVFTIVFSTAVLAGALDTMDRELNMWPSGAHKASPVSGDMIITGLHSEYAESEAIIFHVSVPEAGYDCGTLDMQMRNSVGELIEEQSYDSQCYTNEILSLPLDGFSTVAGPPGSYTLTVTMSMDEDQLLASAVFTVR